MAQRGSAKYFKKKPFALQGQRSLLFKEKGKQARTTLSMAQRKQVKALIGKTQELKVLDVTSAYAQVDRAGQLMSFTGALYQGATQGDRIGDSCVAKYLDLSLDAYYNAAAISTDVGHKLRVIIFRYNEDTAAGAPALGTIFSTTGSVLITASQLNWTTLLQKEIEVLHDETYALNHSTDLVLRKRIHLFNKKLVFQPGQLTGRGQIFGYLVADDVTGAHTPDVQVQWTSRFAFTDS